METPDLSHPYQRRLHDKLVEALHPVFLDIRDESARHAGHAGHRPGGGTHFAVCIVSAAFLSKKAVERHRMIYQILADELIEHVHALSLEAKTPEEYNQSQILSINTAL